MLEDIIVTIIISIALIHVIWKWMPIKPRRILAGKFVRLATQLKLKSIANYFNKYVISNSSSCSGCSSCNSCNSTSEEKKPVKKEMKISLKSY